MSKVLFTGCSFTAGDGWSKTNPGSECKDSPDLWVNLCHRQLNQLKNLEILNHGQSGISNTEIFKNTTKAIADHGNTIDTIFCQWTTMPRYKFGVGLELWSTTENINITAARPTHDVNLSSGDTWDRKYLNDLYDRLLVLHHLHPEIIKVVEYSNILEKLTKKLNIKIYFINGLCPWDQNYFIRLSDVCPEDFTAFTKKEILNIESRDDGDIFKLYKLIHDEYSHAGGINTGKWVNLYNSFLNNKIDTNYDRNHPGINSNQLYFQQVKDFLTTQ